MSRMLVRSEHRLRTTAKASTEATSHAALPISIAKPSIRLRPECDQAAFCRRGSFGRVGELSALQIEYASITGHWSHNERSGCRGSAWEHRRSPRRPKGPQPVGKKAPTEHEAGRDEL